VTFTVHQPKGSETPLVVEIPHAGLDLDAESLATLAAPASAIGQDADLYVDELYAGAADLGATVLVAHTSRYLCDLNRSEHDVDSLSLRGGQGRAAPHGLVWRQTTDERPALHGPLEPRELERRLELYYRPYHRTLSALLAAKRARFGFAVLLCAHSMPSVGKSAAGENGRPRADVVPGTRGRTSADPHLIEVPDRLAREAGLSVVHDDPYRGGFSTAHYGRPGQGTHAVQVELSRRLYMDEQTLARRPEGFARLRGWCDALVERLGATRVA